MNALRRSFGRSVAVPAAVVLAALLSLVAVPSAAADVVFNAGNGAGGAIHAMDDNGGNIRVLVPGTYIDPYVALDGTVLFTDPLNLPFPSGYVHAYKDGAARVLANDFDTGANQVEAGYQGRYVFHTHADQTLRLGSLPSGTTTALPALCRGEFSSQYFPSEFTGAEPSPDDPFDHWEPTSYDAVQPTVRPNADEVIFTGCTWRRATSNGLVAMEERPMLESYSSAGGERPLVLGPDSWEFADPSAGADGGAYVFILWRGYDAWSASDPSPPLAIKRVQSEGIYVFENDAFRQVLTLAVAEDTQAQNVNSPRIAGPDRIVFGFEDAVSPARDGIYSISRSCNACPMSAAQLLHAGGTQPAWTPLHVAAPDSTQTGENQRTQTGGTNDDGPGPVVVRDTTPPAISGFTLSPATFRAARSGASTAAARIGTRVRYRVSEAGRLAVGVTRLLPGRRRGQACRAPSRRNRHGKPCMRAAAMGAFTRASSEGANSFRFTGRLRNRRLAPGRYLLDAIAFDAAGNASPAVRRRFTIVR